MRYIANTSRRRQLFSWLAATLFLSVVGSLGVISAGDNKLPTAEDIKKQQEKYQGERDKVVKSGATKLFLPGFFEKAEAFAKQGEAALKGGRLLQAQQAYVQARWQLPYLGPTVPDHVHRILGNVRLRHSGSINAVAYSPDGKYMATASDDRSVKIWDLENGHELVQYVGHGDAVRAIAFSSDGKLIASGGGDDYIKVWNPGTGQTLRTLKGQRGYVTSLVLSPENKYVCSAWTDNAVRIFETATGNLVRTISDFQQRVNSIAFDPEGKILAAAVGDGQVRLWQYPAVAQNANQPEFWSDRDLQGASYHVAFSFDGKSFARCYPVGIHVYQTPNPLGGAQPKIIQRAIPLPKPLDGSNQTVRFNCSIFGKDGKTLFTGANDGVIRLYELNTGQLTGTFKGHNAEIKALAWNRDGTELASCSADHTIRLWPFDIVSQSREFVGHKDAVWMAAVSPDGQRLVSASADKTLKVWDATTGKELFALEGHTTPVTVAQFSPDGASILSAAGDKTLKLWSAADGKLIKTMQGHQGTVTTADFSRDSKKIVSGGVDRLIKVWEVATGKELLNMETDSLVTAVAFHPGGKQIASGHVDQTIRLWDAESGKVQSNWVAHGEAVTGIAYSQDGQKLASCGTDSLVKVWTLANAGSDPLVFSGHSGQLSAVAFRPDGKFVISGGSDQVVKLWKLADGSTRDAAQDFRGHRNWVTSVTFSKDGFFIVSASMDNSVRLWEQTSKELPLLSEHTGAVKAVAVSPDGKLIASAATDQTIKIWDFATGVEKMTLKGHAGHVVALTFSPDNKILFSSGTDRNIFTWDLTTGQLRPQQGNWQGLKIPSPLMHVTPDGKKFLVWTPEGNFSTKVKLYDLPGGNLLMEGVDPNRNVLAAAFTSDAKKIALAAADGSVRIYQVENNRMDVQPGGDWFRFNIGEKATSVALTPDGSKMAAGNEKGEVKIADVTQRKVLHTLKGHTSAVRACVISPDGKLCATSGDDNVIKLWDLASGKELRVWTVRVPEQIESNFTPQMAFSPDSKYLVTANANTTLYVLDVP